MLKKKKRGVTIEDAIKVSDLKLLKTALEDEAHVRACYIRTKAGFEPLLNAAIRSRCSVEIIEYLLQCGACPFDQGVNVKMDAVDILLCDVPSDPLSEDNHRDWAFLACSAFTPDFVSDDHASLPSRAGMPPEENDEWCCQAARSLGKRGTHVENREGAADRARSAGKPRLAACIERMLDITACRMLIAAARREGASYLFPRLSSELSEADASSTACSSNSCQISVYQKDQSQGQGQSQGNPATSNSPSFVELNHDILLCITSFVIEAQLVPEDQ